MYCTVSSFVPSSFSRGQTPSLLFSCNAVRFPRRFATEAINSHKKAQLWSGLGGFLWIYNKFDYSADICAALLRAVLELNILLILSWRHQFCWSDSDRVRPVFCLELQVPAGTVHDCTFVYGIIYIPGNYIIRTIIHVHYCTQSQSLFIQVPAVLAFKTSYKSRAYFLKSICNFSTPVN